ncbi:hypothetical protein HMPREF1549_01280 [Actinomyces johnsonii F0510]|uniref:Uncharacterized protein n=1 Tax=Actinomyces johnsonii F0510 TaxID=1227262 RepID=U1PWS5_9ACTO|nr:hypothetical protein HMPREF1549_01280 [Actinomyces johnsonii F0510]
MIGPTATLLRARQRRQGRPEVLSARPALIGPGPHRPATAHLPATRQLHGPKDH